MQRFKKHARLITEQMGGTISYGSENSLTVDFGGHSARFMPDSKDPRDGMTCQCSWSGTEFTLYTWKNCIFDIIDRLASEHGRETLREYQSGQLLELSDYIEQEDAALDIQQLRDRLVAEPELQYLELGGNCIFVEFVRGALIIRDDLCRLGTNVVDF